MNLKTQTNKTEGKHVLNESTGNVIDVVSNFTSSDVLQEGFIGDAIQRMKDKAEHNRAVNEYKHKSKRIYIPMSKAKSDYTEMVNFIKQHLKTMKSNEFKTIMNMSNFDEIYKKCEEAFEEDPDREIVILYSAKEIPHKENQSIAIWSYKQDGTPKDLPYALCISVDNLIVSDEVYEKHKKYIEDNKHLLNESVTVKERNKMDKSLFGLPDDEKYPLDTIEHVKSAIAYFGKTTDTKKQKELAKNIIRRVKELKAEGKVYVHDGNPLYGYVPRSMQYNKTSVRGGTTTLNESVTALDKPVIIDCLQESIQEFRDNLQHELGNGLWSIDTDNVQYSKTPPSCLIESAGEQKANFLWNIILEDAEFKSLNTSTAIPVIYSMYAPMSNWDSSLANGGLGDRDLDSMTDDDIFAFYNPAKNKYPARGMLGDIGHIRFVNKLNKFHDRYMNMDRNPEEDKEFVQEWYDNVKNYHETYLKAQPQIMDWAKQRLYDIRWNCEDNPLSYSVLKHNLDPIVDNLNVPIQESYNDDIYLYNNNGLMTIQEGIGSDISKWFLDKKAQVKTMVDDLRKKRASEKEFAQKWKKFKQTDLIELPVKMNALVEPIINKFSMNDILSVIGIKLDGDVFRKYGGDIPVDEMKSLVVAGTFKHDNVDYLKGMVLSQLCNFLVLSDRKDTPLTKPTESDDIPNILMGKYLGHTEKIKIHTNVFAANAKLIPSIIATNIKTIDSFQKEMHTLMNNITKTQAENKEIHEIEVFKDVFDFISEQVVDILLAYNDMLLGWIDKMDETYAMQMAVHESVEVDILSDMPVLTEAIDIKAGIKVAIDATIKHINAIIDFIREKLSGRFNDMMKHINDTINQIKKNPNNKSTVKVHKSLLTSNPSSINVTQVVRESLHMVQDNTRLDFIKSNMRKASGFFDPSSDSLQINTILEKKDPLTEVPLNSIEPSVLKENFSKINESLASCTKFLNDVKNSVGQVKDEWVIQVDNYLISILKCNISLCTSQLNQIAIIWGALLSTSHVNSNINESVMLLPNNDDELALHETIWSLMNNYGDLSPLLETVDTDLYAEYIPLLESFNDVMSYVKGKFNDLKQSTIDAISEFKKGDFSRIKKIPGMLRDYLFKLTPENAKNILPEVILWATRHKLYAIIYAGVLTVTGLNPMTAGFVTSVIGEIIDIVIEFGERVISNGINMSEADKNIKACEEAISDTDKKISDSKTDPKMKAILQAYKVRLTAWIAELKESKIQKDVVTSVKNKLQKSPEPIHESVNLDPYGIFY